jgi:uncharacterized protein
MRLGRLSEAEGVSPRLAEKARSLLEVLGELCPVGVALSGGVDSSLLAAAAAEACGEGAATLTARTAFHPDADGEAARKVARKLDIRHLEVRVDILGDRAIAGNPDNRCYLCKRMLFQALMAAGEEAGFGNLVEGSTVDDLSDYRPGERALLELGVRSPLREADLGKAEVRALARALGLPGWNRPASPCLATRVPHGTAIGRELLERIERLERLLGDLGFREVRARCHGDILRVEVEPAGIERAASPEVREAMVQAGRREGFRYVTLDLQGYRTGSMNP